MTTQHYERHYEQATVLPAPATDVFSYVDDFSQLSSHMTKSSAMMGGGSMEISFDSGNGQAIGSHVRMKGRMLGINLFLEEVVTERNPPYHKAWETISHQLLIIGNYRLGFDIAEKNNASTLRVFIDYNLPSSSRWLGYIFGNMYAKWCVEKMIKDARHHFSENRP